MAEAVPQDEIRRLVHDFLQGKDMNQTSANDVRRHIETQLTLPDLSLKPRMDEVKKEIGNFVQAQLESTRRPARPAAKSAPKKLVKKKTSGKPAPTAKGAVKNKPEHLKMDKTEAMKGGIKKAQSRLMTKWEFLEAAKKLKIDVGGGKGLSLIPKHFATGSVGLFHSGKMYVEIGSTTIQMQVNFMLTAVGSKEWVEGAPTGKLPDGWKDPEKEKEGSPTDTPAPSPDPSPEPAAPAAAAPEAAAPAE
mmetsp:Transcript_42607/g.95880  ORF Transcript_42607/g.95880 Transcript_42607/m.95880 type:complete len:248 (-) Transcript_42607:193-936(-)